MCVCHCVRVCVCMCGVCVCMCVCVYVCACLCMCVDVHVCMYSCHKTCTSSLQIADFGMSRDLADDDYYVGHDGKVPVKWTAPEALHCKKYSTASDVWSYGCLLYEIWSLGHKPFKGFSNTEVWPFTVLAQHSSLSSSIVLHTTLQAIEKVDSGYRLPPPPGCPKVVYEIMIQCW